jgi:hypothetical protein
MFPKKKVKKTLPNILASDNCREEKVHISQYNYTMAAQA